MTQHPPTPPITMTLSVTLKTFPCHVCGKPLTQRITDQKPIHDAMEAQGANLPVTRPYYGSYYICKECAEKAPQSWCIGCKTEIKVGEYGGTEPHIIVHGENGKHLCQRCYQTMPAMQWQDLIKQLTDNYDETEAEAE